jgi:dihydrofolate reductase
MNDTTPQESRSKILMHFTMSLDGFVAGPNHAMDWMTGTPRAGLIGEYVETTGALICGRDGWNGIQHARPYGGAWQGPIFILTHHPEDAVPTDGVTFLNCDVAEAARIALRAAEGKNVEVLSPSIGRQLLERNLVDEIDLHIAPVLLGAGIRLFDNPAGQPIKLTLLNGPEPSSIVNLRYAPAVGAAAG